MPQTDYDRTVALAALLQTTKLVQSIARSGQADADDMTTCIESLFKLDAANSVDIYGGLQRLRNGLRLLVEQLKQPQDMEITRYVLSLLALERKLARRSDMLATIRRDIEACQTRLEHFPVTHDNILAALADSYAKTISKLTPKIMVSGDHTHLSSPENANRIRLAFFLVAVRVQGWSSNSGPCSSNDAGRGRPETHCLLRYPLSRRRTAHPDWQSVTTHHRESRDANCD